jgi:prepilin-type N-terminal cleavage/methylation domain-containing protein
MVGCHPSKNRLGVKTLRNKTQKGFTLIELLVVIAIIGLLASVVLLALNSARSKSRDAKRVADVRQLASAMELYFNDNNSYPIQATAALTIPGLATTYIGAIPAAPTPADGSCTSTTNPYNYNSYRDSANATASVSGDVVATNPALGYHLTFCVGAVTGGLTAGAHTLTQSGIQ